MNIIQLNDIFLANKELIKKDYFNCHIGIEVDKNHGNLNSNFQIFINKKLYIIGMTNILETYCDKLESIYFAQDTKAKIIIQSG